MGAKRRVNHVDNERYYREIVWFTHRVHKFCTAGLSLRSQVYFQLYEYMYVCTYMVEVFAATEHRERTRKSLTHFFRVALSLLVESVGVPRNKYPNEYT